MSAHFVVGIVNVGVDVKKEDVSQNIKTNHAEKRYFGNC